MNHQDVSASGFVQRSHGNLTNSFSFICGASSLVRLSTCIFLFLLQSEKFSRNASLLDSGHVQQTAAMLANATVHTEKYYGSDVKVAYRLTQSLLQHESSQQGFNLTATQDVHFTEVNNHTLPVLTRNKNDAMFLLVR